jgi:hypothetical protein
MPGSDAAGPSSNTTVLAKFLADIRAHRSSFERRRPGGKGKAHTSDQSNAECQIQCSQFTHGEQVCEPARRSGDDMEVEEIAHERYACRCRRDVQSAKRWGNSRRDDSRHHAHYKNHQTPHRRHTSVITPHPIGLRAKHAVRRSIHRTPYRARPTPDAHQEAEHRGAGDRPRYDPA